MHLFVCPRCIAKGGSETNIGEYEWYREFGEQFRGESNGEEVMDREAEEDGEPQLGRELCSKAVIHRHNAEVLFVIDAPGSSTELLRKGMQLRGCFLPGLPFQVRRWLSLAAPIAQGCEH